MGGKANIALSRIASTDALSTAYAWRSLLDLQTMDVFAEIRIERWSDIHRLNRYALRSLVFRGQADAKWTLSTSPRGVITDTASLKALQRIGNIGCWHEFKRRYHLYGHLPPAEEDLFEWLAIMQHHGAPTRLLDFTESLYVAAFFAVVDSTTEAAVWCINRWVLRDRLRDYFRLPYSFGDVLRDPAPASYSPSQPLHRTPGPQEWPTFVVPLEPELCTERLSLSEGLFLMPTTLKLSFMETMFSSSASSKRRTRKLGQMSFDTFAKAEPVQ